MLVQDCPAIVPSTCNERLNCASVASVYCQHTNNNKVNTCTRTRTQSARMHNGQTEVANRKRQYVYAHACSSLDMNRFYSQRQLCACNHKSGSRHEIKPASMYDWWHGELWGLVLARTSHCSGLIVKMKIKIWRNWHKLSKIFQEM